MRHTTGVRSRRPLQQNVIVIVYEHVITSRQAVTFTNIAAQPPLADRQSEHESRHQFLRLQQQSSLSLRECVITSNVIFVIYQHVAKRSVTQQSIVILKFMHELYRSSSASVTG